MKHQLNIIIGSTRPGRVGPVFAEWLETFAREHGKFEPVLTDIAAFNLPVLDEPHHPRLGNYENDHTKAWSKAIDAADAFVFVAPEYNYFAAPAIVNAIDYLVARMEVQAGRHLQLWRRLRRPARGAGAEAAADRGGCHADLGRRRAADVPETARRERRFQCQRTGAGGAKTMLDELLRWSEALKPMRAA